MPTKQRTTDEAIHKYTYNIFTHIHNDIGRERESERERERDKQTERV